MRQKTYPEAVILNAIQRVANGETVVSVCRDVGITTSCFYQWRRRYLAQDDPLLVRLRALQEQNERLRRLYINERMLLEKVVNQIRSESHVVVVRVGGSTGQPSVRYPRARHV